MHRRRELIVMQTGGLPGAYQAVEWINGADCDIDLQYTPKVKPRAVARFAITAAGDRDVMGFAQNTQPSFIIDCYLSGNGPTTRWYNRYFTTSSYSFVYDFGAYDEYHDFDFGRTVYVDGVFKKETENEGDWSVNTQSFHVFAARTRHVGVKLYTFKLYDGDNLVRDLIPCYRKLDAVIGVYDKISKAFYTSTSGSFTKGQDI